LANVITFSFSETCFAVKLALEGNPAQTPSRILGVHGDWDSGIIEVRFKVEGLLPKTFLPALVADAPKSRASRDDGARGGD